LLQLLSNLRQPLVTARGSYSKSLTDIFCSLHI